MYAFPEAVVQLEISNTTDVPVDNMLPPPFLRQFELVLETNHDVSATVSYFPVLSLHDDYPSSTGFQ